MMTKVTALPSLEAAVRTIGLSRRSLCDGPCDDPVDLDVLQIVMTHYYWRSDYDVSENRGDAQSPDRGSDCGFSRARGGGGVAIDFGFACAAHGHRRAVHSNRARVAVDCGLLNGGGVDVHRGNGFDWAIAGIVAGHRDGEHRENATFHVGDGAAANDCTYALMMIF